MNIISVSILNNFNFGTVLQNYATNQYLIDKGHDAFVADYMMHKDLSVFGKRAFLGLIKNVLKFLPIRILKINNFIKKNIRLTKKYYSYKDFVKNPPQADCYMVGSDQVWNVKISGRNDVFLLKWANRGAKMSYSSSVAEHEIPEDELNRLACEIKQFDYVAVREKTGKTILEQADGIDEVKWVVDPVFLIDKSKYEQFVYPNKYGKYVLVIGYSSNELLKEKVKEIKEKCDIKVIELGYSDKLFGSDIFLRNAGIEDFLTLIANAELVITQQFHALAFCMIFNKKFITIKRNWFARIESLLEITGIQNRTIFENDGKDVTSYFEDIDWTAVNSKLSDRVADSKKWLDSALAEIESRVKE